MSGDEVAVLRAQKDEGAQQVNATGQIERIDLRYVNGEFLNFAGVTANVLYSLELGRYGALQLGATGFNPRRLESSNTGIFVDQMAGELGNPERQYRFNVGYQIGSWGLSWYARYTGSSAYDLEDTIDNRDVLRVDGQWLHNAGLSYRISDSGQLRLSVTNVLDQDPPPIAFGYDTLGRRYSLLASWKFQ